MPSTHVTDREIELYCGRQLGGAALVAFTDHLSDCEECRRLLVNRSRGNGLTGLERELEAFVDHVPEAEVQAYADGRLEPGRRAQIDSHLARCPSCAAEIRDLQEFAATQQGTRPRRWPIYAGLAAAAALVAAVGLSVLIGRQGAPELVVALADQGGMVGVDATGALAGVDGLTDAQRDVVRQALTTQRLSVPSSVSELRGVRSTLLGASGTSAFQLLAPVGTVVLQDRPTLRWSSVPGSVQYSVTLLDEVTGNAIDSPTLQTTAWTPDAPLPRGHTYVWQVAAATGGGEVVAPVPPEPRARFTVLNAEAVSAFERLPASHLARGILYASAGLMDDAERELTALSALNVDSAAAAALLKQVQER